MKNVVIITLVLAVILGFLFWKFGPSFTRKETFEKEITLTIYGLWEDESLLKVAFENYKKDNPKVNIKYVFQSSVNFSRRVQTQIKEGEGPDIFLIHNTWLPWFLKDNFLSAAPESVFSINDYSSTFYPIAKESFTKDNKIYGVPRGVDGIALYYNEDIVREANITLPRTWDQFRDAAIKATVTDSSGKIQRAGAAIGTASNVDHFSDILGLLFYQQRGANPENPSDEAGQAVFKFYTGFVTDPTRRVWDQTFEHSTDAFASGKVAFYFGPSWRAHELRAKNPQLKFKTTAVPQLPGKSVAFANFWGYGVSAKSPNSEAAWKFLKYLTSSETEKFLYQEAAKVRLFGLPYSRVDMQKELAADPVVGSFVLQGPYYKGWYLASSTADSGINDEMIKYFEDNVNSAVAGQDSTATYDTLQKGVKQTLDKFVNAAPPPSPE